MVSISLQISGPLLPKPLQLHSMVRLGKGQAILGGCVVFEPFSSGILIGFG